VSRARRHLFGVPRHLHSVGRRQVAHRGAVPARCREGLERPLGLGGADVQRHRGARESDPSVLDAAARRHSWLEGARHRRLFDAAVRRARAARAAARLVAELHAAVRGARPAVDMPGFASSNDRWFYSGMATLLAGVIFAGFVPTFFARAAYPDLPPLPKLALLH